MQTTRFLVVIGAVAAVWASPLPGFAATESETQDKLREALHKKMEAMDAEAPAAPAPKSAAPTEVVPVPEAPAAKSDSVFSEVPTGNDNPAAEKQRAAMRQTIAAESVSPTPAPGATAMVASQPAIPSAFNSAQQERLAALLQQYKADQITPQDYHKQRAAIIAAP